jgi:hypothetical protein
MSINIYNFVVEITRKCNLQCSHCCRGNAQNKNLDIQKLDSFLRHVDYISTLTIGGGEPSLALDTLEKLRWMFNYNRTKVGNIFVVTNGKYRTVALAEWYYDFYINVANENEVSSFGFSFDQWHNWEMTGTDHRKRHFWEVSDLFEQYGIGEPVKHSDEKWSYDSLIAQGRSKYNGNRTIGPEILQIKSYSDIDEVSEGEIYFTHDGQIYSNCNLSYETMKKSSPFHVCQWDKGSGFIEKVREYNRKFEEVLIN